MKLSYVVGDLITAAKDGKIDVIAHQCNCFCKMKRGIAPLIAKMMPEVRAVDNATKEGDYLKLGSCSRADGYVGSDNKPLTVFNLYGQYHWKDYKEPYGGNTNYLALDHALKEMIQVLTDSSFSINNNISGRYYIGMPLIGAGLAGGDWQVIENIIINAFKNNYCVKPFIFVLDEKILNKLDRTENIVYL